MASRRATYPRQVDRCPLLPLPVPAGARALQVRDALARALSGAGPAVAPYAPDSAPPDLPELRADDLPDGLALVVGTSGSTGAPKRALLTASALRASARATHDRVGGPGQWLLAMPAHHVAGLQVLVRSIVAGTEPQAVDTSAGFTMDVFAAATDSLDTAVPRHYTALVPTQLVRLLQDPRGRAALQRYDAVLLGGAAAPSALLASAGAAGVRVLTTYGMSETAGGCVYDGEPLACSRVRVEADGRILLGGDTLASGYLGRPYLTDAVFARDADGRRWFRTDDQGSVRPDGRLVVTGRVDDVINTGGVKVAPRQVEEALLGHVPGVSEAVVVGTPDPEWGEAVGAVVVLAGGREDLTVGDVRTALRGVLPGPALPRHVVAVAAIPVRGPGKPDRREIRRILALGATYDRATPRD
jgi:o-succinylbenzoate---CoA ligase